MTHSASQGTPGRLRSAALSPRGRRAIALLTIVAVLAVAIVGAVLSTDAAGGLNLFVEGLSARSSGLLGDVGVLLPLGFAFAAGMVSAVNPCGFPMLPAYLGIFLAERDIEAGTRRARLLRALVIAGTVTLGFVVLFTVAGLTIGLGARVLVSWLPWIALVLGVVLVLAGGYRLAGGSLYSTAPESLGARVSTGGRGTNAYFLFGIAYGIASLSCTLPIFLAVVGATVTAATLLPSLGSLTLYGLGMGSVIFVLTVAAALFKTAVATRMRRIARYVDGIGTAALLLAGGYIVYYWLTIGGLLGTVG